MYIGIQDLNFGKKTFKQSILFTLYTMHIQKVNITLDLLFSKS